jgi:hypothetical protein
VKNQKTHHDMSFWHNQSASSQSSCAGSKTHPSDRRGHKTCTRKLPLLVWGFFPHFSLRVEGRLWVGWVVSFGGFDCCFLFVVGGARNKLGSTLLTLIFTPLKTNTQFVCGFGCTLLNPTKIILDHFFAQSNFLMTCSQIGNLLLKLGVLFGSMEKLTLERATRITWRG